MKDILAQYGFSSQEIQKILYRLAEKGSTFTQVSFAQRVKSLFEMFQNFGFKKNYEIRKILTKAPQILTFKVETVLANIQKMPRLLEISDKQFIDSCLKQPALLSQFPETINQNIEQAAQMLGITKQEFVKACLKQVSLFIQSPETIKKNVEQTAQMLGISESQYVQVCLKQPPLFSQLAETVNQNIEKSAQLLDFKKEEFLSMAVKLPSLFMSAPDSIYHKYKFIRRVYIKDMLRVSSKIKGSVATKDQLKGYVMTHPMVLGYSMDNLACKVVQALDRNLKNRSQRTPISVLMTGNKILYRRLKEADELLVQRHGVVKRFFAKQERPR